MRGIRSSITPRCPVTGDVNREVTLIIGDDDAPLSFSRVTLLIFFLHTLYIFGKRCFKSLRTCSFSLNVHPGTFNFHESISPAAFIPVGSAWWWACTSLMPSTFILILLKEELSLPPFYLFVQLFYLYWYGFMGLHFYSMACHQCFHCLFCCSSLGD